MNIERYSKLVLVSAIVSAIAVFLLVQNARPSLVTAVSASVDINAEVRTVDAFADGLGKLEKRRSELAGKVSVTTDEFVSLGRLADDLKGRVPAVQSALQEIVRKLKADGQWNALNETLLAKVQDAKVRSFFQRLGFKQTLEQSASRLLENATDIHSPIEALRGKVKAEAQPGSVKPGSSTLALQAVRVAYPPLPAAVTQSSATSFRCRVAGLRFGLAVAIKGGPTQGATDAVACFCFDNPGNCVNL